LFIVFCGYHYLYNLRKLGFKTFDGIIDESYDNIQDTDERFSAALAQMQYLIDQPQEAILEKIRPITEHNKNLMISLCCHTNYLEGLKEFLLTST